MVKKNTIWGICCIIIFSLLVLAGCGTKPAATPEQAAKSDKQPIKKQMVMAVNATFPPFESVKLVNGQKQYEGLDIDIANAIAKDLGFEFTITDMAFAGIIGSLKDGRADFAITGMSPTPERAKNVDFSDPYFYACNAIVALKGSNFKSMDDLTGKKIGVPFGTTYENDAKTVKDAKVIAIDGSPAVIQEVLGKRVDAALLDGVQASVFISKNPGLEMSVLPPTDKHYAIVFPKGSPLVEPFNKSLKKMKENGELEKLVNKWVGPQFRQKK